MIYLDSNIFIYAAVGDSKYSKRCELILQSIESKKLSAITSLLTLCEVQHKLSKFIGKAESMRAMEAILSYPIEFRNMDMAVLNEAFFKIQYLNLKIFDAIHLATAKIYGAESICSYDRDFDIEEIKRFEP